MIIIGRIIMLLQFTFCKLQQFGIKKHFFNKDFSNFVILFRTVNNYYVQSAIVFTNFLVSLLTYSKIDFRPGTSVLISG